MNAIAILFALGLIFLGFEVIVPGAVLGIVGGLALLGGVIVAFVVYGVSGGLTAFGIALVLIGVMLFLEFYVFPKTAMGKRLFLRATVSGSSQPAVAERRLIGQDAEVQTTLSPSGFVLIDGRRYEAFSQSGHVQKGERVRVVGMDNFRIIVTKP